MFNWPISVQVIERIPIAHVIIIIKSEISTLPIVIIFFRGCVPEMFVTSYFVTCCIYIPEKAGFCFHYYCTVYDECKWSDTFWLADRIRLFVHYTIPLSSLCKLIWRHLTIHHTIYGAVCFYFTISLVMIEIIYTLSYYHHIIGSMNFYPLFRIRSWNEWYALYVFLCFYWKNWGPSGHLNMNY